MEKWAVLLAKTADTADINNLRPIGLEDCMRKLWFSISYKRIAAAWDKYGALDKAHHGLYLTEEQTVASSIYSISRRKRKNGGYQHYCAHGMSNEPLSASVARLYARH